MQDSSKLTTTDSRAYEFLCRTIYLVFKVYFFQGRQLRSTYFIFFTHSKDMFEYMMENVDGIPLSEPVFNVSQYAPRCAVSSLAATPEKYRSLRRPL